jgi:Protein of unknown function (DUF2384)
MFPKREAEMPIVAKSSAARPGKEAALTKAVLRAADKLDIKAKYLASVLGLSETTLSRMKKGTHFLEADTKPFELGVLFVRLFRSLDAIVGGDEAVARSWLANSNTALDDRPAEKIRTIAGLTDVIAYLDARRAIL